MDRNLFTRESPGTLVPIEDGDVAFLPEPLPPRWEFPARLWPLLSDAMSCVRELNAFGFTLPNPTILLRPLADREAIKSSRIEGTYATAKELLLFELQPTGTPGVDGTQDYREVYNYQRALYHGTSSELPLSLRLIRELHGILLANVRGRDKTPGDFRKVQVAIGATRRFIPPPPNHVEDCMQPLETYFHDESKTFEPLVYCFLVHYQFETIHPFVDGNGRVGRLLLAIMMQQRCELARPWLYLSEFFERHRDEYVERLFAVSTRAAWSEWIEFCLLGTVEHAKNTIALCKKLIEMREQYAKRVADSGGNIRLSIIVDDIFSSPFVRVSSLAKRLNVTYPTAKSDLERLVNVGILKELSGVNPKTFYAPEVFGIAYGGMDDGDEKY